MGIQKCDDTRSSRPGTLESSRKIKRRKRAEEERREPVRLRKEEFHLAGIETEAPEGQVGGHCRHLSTRSQIYVHISNA